MKRVAGSAILEFMKVLTDPGVLDEAIRRLQALPPDAARQWGKMSVGGMLCHLNDAYAGVLAMRRAGLTGAAKASWAGRNVMRPLALHIPMKWPKGVATVPAADQLVGGTPPLNFAADKERALASLKRFSATDMDGTIHPIFGRMTQWEWMRWAWLHVDHHLRQFGA